MRILLVAQWFPPIIGGEERHVRDLGLELIRRGNQVAVATLHHPGQEAEELDGEMLIHRISGTAQRMTGLFADLQRRSAQPLPDPGTTRALERIVDTWRPDVVHAHNWMVYSYLPLRRAGGPPLVLTLHDYSWICPKKDLMLNGRICSGPELAKCLRCAAGHYGAAKAIVTVLAHRLSAGPERRGVDQIIAVSTAVATGNRLSVAGVPFRVIPNFVSPATAEAQEGAPFDPLLAQLPDEPFILFVGAFSKIKGVGELLRAYGDGNGLPPLVLIGYPTADRFDELEAAQPRVTVLRAWPPGAVRKAWARSAFGVVPSIWGEPSPTVVLEAMQAGRAVVASKIGGLPDMVDEGQTGLLVQPGDVPKLRRALDTLTADTPLRERMGAEAQRRVERFTAGSVVPQIEQVYLAAIAPRQATAGRPPR